MPRIRMPCHHADGFSSSIGSKMPRKQNMPGFLLSDASCTAEAVQARWHMLFVLQGTGTALGPDDEHVREAQKTMPDPQDLPVVDMHSLSPQELCSGSIQKSRQQHQLVCRWAAKHRIRCSLACHAAEHPSYCKCFPPLGRLRCPAFSSSKQPQRLWTSSPPRHKCMRSYGFVMIATLSSYEWRSKIPSGNSNNHYGRNAVTRNQPKTSLQRAKNITRQGADLDAHLQGEEWRGPFLSSSGCSAALCQSRFELPVNPRFRRSSCSPVDFPPAWDLPGAEAGRLRKGSSGSNAIMPSHGAGWCKPRQSTKKASHLRAFQLEIITRAHSLQTEQRPPATVATRLGLQPGAMAGAHVKTWGFQRLRQDLRGSQRPSGGLVGLVPWPMHVPTKALQKDLTASSRGQAISEPWSPRSAPRKASIRSIRS